MDDSRRTFLVMSGGVVHKAEGFYDAATKTLTVTSSRPATEAELFPPGHYHPSNTTMDTTPSKGITGSANTHARLAPSNAKQWTDCTASIAFIEANRDRIPPENTTYADEGTEAHEWAAKVLLGSIGIMDVPEDFREYVGAYVTHCLSLVPAGVTPQVEISVPLFYQPDQNGTCDFAVVTDDRVVVRDLKYGAGVLVTNEENPQLAIYASSLIAMLEDVYDFHPATVVDIAVFQPRHREAGNVKPWVITLADLQNFCRDITIAAATIKAGANLKFAPSEGDQGACRWCKAKSFCEARKAAAIDCIHEVAESPEDLIAKMPNLDAKEKKLDAAERVEARWAKTGNEALTDAQMVALWSSYKNFVAFVEDIGEALHQRLLAGETIPGTKLVLGRQGNREWTNEAEADTFLKGQGLKQDDRYNFKLKSPTQIEEMLQPKLQSSKRTASRFAELVSRSDAKKVLALESDKRPAVEPDVTSIMPDIEAVDEYEV